MLAGVQALRVEGREKLIRVLESGKPPYKFLAAVVGVGIHDVELVQFFVELVLGKTEIVGSLSLLLVQTWWVNYRILKTDLR